MREANVVAMATELLQADFEKSIHAPDKKDMIDDLCASCESGDCEMHASRKLSRRTEFAGLKISIETDKGETREGVSADGKPWKVTMPWPYGYIRSTMGVDGDHVDCFLGPDPDADEVYVIHQSKDGDPEIYDEDKCMLGFASADAAKQAYNDAYSNGGAFYRSMTAMPIAEFKQKVLATKDQTRRTKIHAGGPGSGRHSESIPVLKEGQRGVGKSDDAVFPVHGPKSNLPGRHFSHGQYTKSGNGWTAPNKKTGGTLTVQRTNNEDGSVKVTRYTTYKQGPKEVTQSSEVLQYPDKQSADAHMMKRFGITAEFDESQHPRDKDGKFGSGGGTVSSADWENWFQDSTPYRTASRGQEIVDENGNRVDAKDIEHIKEVANGIQQLASSQAVSNIDLFRGENYPSEKALLDKYQLGSTIQTDALTSTSTSRSIARSYADRENFGTLPMKAYIRYRGVDGHKGVPVQLGGKSVSEVVLPRGAAYKVIAIDKVATDAYSIALKVKDAIDVKKTGLVAAAISAREDRIRAFALDALQCDFDESLHPRDKGGKFASKGESGAQPITPPKKVAQLNQMGFQYKGSHLDESGKVTKDVFEKIGTPHEVHVSKYNTSHPGNADLRKYAVVDKLAGKTLQQGHQISKVQDFVNQHHLPVQTTTAPVQAPAPKAAPVQSPIAEPWTLSNGGTTSTVEGKALQNAGFIYQSSTGGGLKSEDLWTHPSGAYVKVTPSGFKVASANGTEDYVSGPANKDFDGKQAHAAIENAVADSQAVKNAPTEPVTVSTGKLPDNESITSKSEQSTLVQHGFEFKGPSSSGTTEYWQHPSGVYLDVTPAGYTLSDKNGISLGSNASTVYETIGKLDKPIKDAIDNAGKVSTSSTGLLVNQGSTPYTPGLASSVLKSNGFSPAGTKSGGAAGPVDVWTHPSGHTVEYTSSGDATLKDSHGGVVGTYEGVYPNQETLKADLSHSMTGSDLVVHDSPKTTLVSEDEAMKNAGFSYIGTKKEDDKDVDVFQHPNGTKVETTANSDVKIIAPNGSVTNVNGILHHPDVQNALKSATGGSTPPVPAVVIKPAPAGVEPNKAGYKQNYYKQEGFVFTGKGPYDADVWKHPSGVTVQVMSTKHNVIMPGEAKKSYQGTPTSWDMKQYVGKAQLQTPAQPAAPAAKPSGSILLPSTVKVFENAGLKLTTGGGSNQELWTHSSGVAVLVQKNNAAGLGSIGWNVKDSSGKMIKEAANTGFVKGTQLSPQLLDALNKASTPAEHPTKAAGPVIPASGKNTALSNAGYEFQKHENGSDYWTKPGAAYGVKISAIDATHSGFDVLHNTTGAVHSSGKDAGTMVSTLDQVNGPKPSPQAQQYVPPTPAGPKKDWTENTDKAWQQKARDTVASVWSKASDSAKAYTNNPTGVYNDIAKALGVPFLRLQEVKERIGSWQGGTTAASGGNKIGTWAQDIVNNRDQVHPGLFIEHLVTQERIKEQYGGVVPTLYRGLHSPGDPESAGSGPAKGNIGVLKGLAQMSAEGFHTNFPVFGAEGFSSAKSVSTSFGGSGVVITKAKGNLPSNWIMTSRDINPGMWTGYAGEHEWAVACPEIKDAKTGTMIPKLPIDTEKGDHIQGAGVVHAAMDPEEADNRVFELLSMLKKSGWDYALDGKEITVYPPVGWTNAAWFAEARKPQTAMTASEEKPVRKIMIPGLSPISIEYEVGQTRTGTDQNGRAWSHVMPYAYGRFIGTKGLDGEAVDVILGRNSQSKKVFVACLPKNLGNEEKVMVGFDTIQQAKIAFLACYGYKQQFLQTIGEVTKPLLMTLMKVKNGKSALLQSPREMKIAAEADYFSATPGLNVLPTSYPPSLKTPRPVDDPLATDGWRSGDSKKSKKQAREDLVQIMTRTGRQAGNKPPLARTAALNYQNPYPDVLL